MTKDQAIADDVLRRLSGEPTSGDVGFVFPWCLICNLRSGCYTIDYHHSVGKMQKFQLRSGYIRRHPHEDVGMRVSGGPNYLEPECGEGPVP